MPPLEVDPRILAIVSVQPFDGPTMARALDDLLEARLDACTDRLAEVDRFRDELDALTVPGSFGVECKGIFDGKAMKMIVLRWAEVTWRHP